METIPEAMTKAAIIRTASSRAFVLHATITIPMAIAVNALSGPVNLFLYPNVIILYQLTLYTNLQIY
jgi:hypothetical protein